MLSNFQLGQHALLQSFLVGQPELRDMLRSPALRQLRQRIIASYHLGPMEEAETRAYVEHRLRKAGWTGDPAWDDDAFPALHAATGGLPRRINSLCNRLMLGTYLAERHRIGAPDVEAAVAELRQELGAESFASDRSSLSDHPESLGRTGETGVPGDAVSRYSPAAICARLDRIEQSLAALTTMVRALPGTDAARTLPPRMGVGSIAGKGPLLGLVPRRRVRG